MPKLWRRDHLESERLQEPLPELRLCVPSWGLLGLMVRAFLLAALLSVACVPLERGSDPRPTLLVVNNGTRSVRVVNEYGHFLGRVFARESKCIVLRRDSPQQIFFDHPYRLIPGPRFNPFDEVGWKIEVGDVVELDVVDLFPAERCK